MRWQPRGRKLRKIQRILEKENSVAGAAQTLLLRTVAQGREGAGPRWDVCEGHS